jgi:hypothetical protein
MTEQRGALAPARAWVQQLISEERTREGEGGVRPGMVRGPSTMGLAE